MPVRIDQDEALSPRLAPAPAAAAEAALAPGSFHCGCASGFRPEGKTFPVPVKTITTTILFLLPTHKTHKHKHSPTTPKSHVVSRRL